MYNVVFATRKAVSQSQIVTA